MSAMLELKNVSAGYGTFQALFDVTLSVNAGEAVAVIGPNGAGKTTLLRAISKLINVKSGDIAFEGRSLATVEPHRIIELGLSQVPEHRRLFPRLTVEENLRMGAYMEAARPKFAQRLEMVYALFPRMKERRHQMAGTMSGGEQQMLAMGRALMARPKVLLMDEPSMGLSPIMVDKIFEVVADIHARGTTVLLVEQNASRALGLADRGYVMDSGEITMAGEAKALLNDPKVRAAYLGE